MYQLRDDVVENITNRGSNIGWSGSRITDVGRTVKPSTKKTFVPIKKIYTVLVPRQLHVVICNL
jgi:hypothetical protein